jgi:hypothetical protein
MLQPIFYVKYIGEDSFSLENGHIYAVVEKEPLAEDLFRIVDETECDYLFTLTNFEVVKPDEMSELDKKRADKRVDECNRKIIQHGKGNF